MKKTLFLIITMSLLILSCSEGDVIEDNFSFSGTLENCSTGDDFVFYKVDSEINQALSLNFTNTTFELNTVPEELTFTITLNSSTNNLIYRQFDSAIDGNSYFCSSVPPGNILVTQELISTNGTATITYVVLSETTTDITYTRTITLTNITLEGNGIAVRKELIELGADELTVAK